MPQDPRFRFRSRKPPRRTACSRPRGCSSRPVSSAPSTRTDRRTGSPPRRCRSLTLDHRRLRGVWSEAQSAPAPLTRPGAWPPGMSPTTGRRLSTPSATRQPHPPGRNHTTKEDERMAMTTFCDWCGELMEVPEGESPLYLRGQGHGGGSWTFHALDLRFNYHTGESDWDKIDPDSCLGQLETFLAERAAWAHDQDLESHEWRLVPRGENQPILSPSRRGSGVGPRERSPEERERDERWRRWGREAPHRAPRVDPGPARRHGADGAGDRRGARTGAPGHEGDGRADPSDRREDGRGGRTRP